MPTDIWRPPLTATVELDGFAVELIPVGPNHRDLIARAFDRLSDASRYHRFMSPVPNLSEAELTYLTDLDMVNHFAWGVLADDDPVAVGRFARTTTRPSAVEVGVTVLDDYHGRGVGTMVVECLAVVARAAGFLTMEFEVLADNDAMLTVLRHLGATTSHDRGIVHAEMELDTVPVPPVDANVLLDVVGAARAVRSRTA